MSWKVTTISSQIGEREKAHLEIHNTLKTCFTKMKGQTTEIQVLVPDKQEMREGAQAQVCHRLRANRSRLRAQETSVGCTT